MNDMEFRKWLADRLDRLEGTQVEIRGELCEVKVDLANHMRRTELAEEAVSLLRDEVKPISAHVAVASGIFKAFVALGSVASVVYAVAKLFAL